MSDPSIVDEHVEAAAICGDAGDRNGHGGVVADVELEEAPPMASAASRQRSGSRAAIQDVISAHLQEIYSVKVGRDLTSKGQGRGHGRTPARGRPGR